MEVIVLLVELDQLEQLISDTINRTQLEVGTAIQTLKEAIMVGASHRVSESMMILSVALKNQLLIQTQTIESHLTPIICRLLQIWAQHLSHLIKLMLAVAILEVAIQTTEIVLLLRVDLLPITNHLQGKVREVIHTTRWHQGAVAP